MRGGGGVRIKNGTSQERVRSHVDVGGGGGE